MNKMFTISLFLTLLAWPCMAADWNKIGESKQALLFIDKDSISALKTKNTKEPLLQADVKTNFMMLQTLQKDVPNRYQSMRMVWAFNCAKNTTAVLAGAYFSQMENIGENIGEWKNPEESWEFQAVPPNSLNEQLLKFVCATKLKKK